MRVKADNNAPAQDYSLCTACGRGQLGEVQHILSQGAADINMRGPQHARTPVMMAVEYGHVAVFDFLAGQGCDLSVKDAFGDNVLQRACAKDRYDIVKKLLDDFQYDIESRGNFGRTPVMRAAYFGHIQIFDMLMNRGCDQTAVDREGSNILHVACIGGKVDMVEHVLSLDINDIESEGEYGRTPVMEAAGKGHRQAFDLLVSRGCNLTAVDNQGSNTLHVACIGGAAHIVRHLLTLGIFWIDSKGADENTPVMIAAKKGHPRVFDVLVSEGCDLSTVNAKGENILHMACMGGNMHIVNHVVSLGIVVGNERNECGQTSLQIAELNGHRQVVIFLKAQGEPT